MHIPTQALANARATQTLPEVSDEVKPVPATVPTVSAVVTVSTVTQTAEDSPGKEV